MVDIAYARLEMVTTDGVRLDVELAPDGVTALTGVVALQDEMRDAEQDGSGWRRVAVTGRRFADVRLRGPVTTAARTEVDPPQSAGGSPLTDGAARSR